MCLFICFFLVSMASQFYLTLPSNSSMEYFPTNTLTNFKTKLVQPIELTGEWEVAHSELQYPRSWYNLRKGFDSHIYYKGGDLNTRMKYDGQIYISFNQYNTPTYNLSSYFPVFTQNSTNIIPERISTRNLNNLILITPNNPENHNLTCDKPIETNSISVNTGLIKVIHLNIHSLRNNVHLIQLRELVRFAKCDIITISETWINTSVTSAEGKHRWV